MILLTFNIINNKKEFKKNFSIDDAANLEITQKNTESILRILELHNVLSTFFVEITIADKILPLLKKIIGKGHEIALFNDNSSFEEIAAVKQKLEDFTEKAIRGMRQKKETHSIGELKTLGFNYISNIENTNILFPFKRLKRSTEIVEKNGISVVPESISPYSQIPYNDFVFQVLPMTYYENMVFETIKNDDYVLIYLNAHQFTDFSKYGFAIPFYRKFNTGAKITDKLNDFLSWANQNELATSRMKDYIF